mmetsp:Transcript_33057/g.98364  ORF Transcript_33057/g.98364 Transcript_33057/m.98364 type:complete len:229 (+) Transcript_33057:742-1428(+)
MASERGVPARAAWQPHCLAFLACRNDRRDEQPGPQHELIVHAERVGVVRELVPQRPQQRCASHVGLAAERVHVGQQRVALTDRVTQPRRRLLAKQPRLAARCIQVRVAAEKRVVRSQLVPAREQLRVRVAKEAANVGAGKRKACDRERQQHRHRRLEVLPLGHVVAGPDGAHCLRADKESARQHKRTVAVLAKELTAAHQHALRGGHVVVQPVLIVQLAVLDGAAMVA